MVKAGMIEPGISKETFPIIFMMCLFHISCAAEVRMETLSFYDADFVIDDQLQNYLSQS